MQTLRETNIQTKSNIAKKKSIRQPKISRHLSQSVKILMWQTLKIKSLGNNRKDIPQSFIFFSIKLVYIKDLQTQS